MVKINTMKSQYHDDDCKALELDTSRVWDTDLRKIRENGNRLYVFECRDDDCSGKAVVDAESLVEYVPNKVKGSNE